MIKFFTIISMAAIAPLAQKTTFTKNCEAYISTFNFKNTIAVSPFEPGKLPPQTTDDLKQSNWYSNALQHIEQSEYHFKWEEKLDAYCTPNRKQNLRFFYNDDGFSVEPRTIKIPLENYEPTVQEADKKYKYLPGWKVKFNLDKKQMGKGLWKVAENKAAYITDNITIQYINSKDGMRQNFILQNPINNGNEQIINFNINTKLKTYVHGNQLQFFHKKTNVLNYEDLKVWDANNKPLNASIQKNKKGKYCIKVDTKNATYPITIDPLSTTPAAIVQSNQTFSVLGWSASSAGDVNGDGYSDIIAGAYGYDNGQVDEGVAFVYHGSAIGINTTAAAILECNQAAAQMGYSVNTAGDVNGDGYSDVIVGASYFNNGQVKEGRAYIFHGSAAGINTTAAATVESDQADAEMGNAVSTAGDVNGDGYSDVIVGAYFYDNGHTNEGRAFVYLGSATGINTTPAATVESNRTSANLGVSVASAGDINGDGYSDIIAGVYFYTNGQGQEGAAFVYHGSATGVNTGTLVILESNQATALFGRSVASAGDVNGDGYSDVIVGSNYYDSGQTDEGAAFVYHGSAAGINTTAAVTLQMNQADALMGTSVASAGDVNGDGYSDVIVGANLYNNGQANEGAAFVYHGSATGISATPVTTLESNQANALFGFSVNSAGDVNGDGYSDVIVGAYEYDNGQTQEGAAYIYHGAAAGLSATPNSTLDDANQANVYFGLSAASAGDVNGDGYSDVIIGAHAYDDGANTNEGRAFVYHGSATGLSSTPNSIHHDANQANAAFGWSAAGAGDVNADGYSDIIIGAFSYSDGANTSEGRAFVYHGSATGLSTTPNNTPDDADQAFANFGISVASAGDVNGDGYGDVIIGASYYEDVPFVSEGRAFIYHGSAAGLLATPNSTPDDADQEAALFGFSVASAGDVNGDGYSDVIIGAYLYTDGANNAEGRAFVYHGSATGISATPNSTPDDADQASALFGYSVASAGDVNGDGYSDVIVGAFGYDDGANTDEGRAFVYHGSAAGLSATPNSTPDDADQMSESFGVSVASAGDVNGDGYSDVIIGSQNYDDGANADEGRAFVYHGSATGLSATHSGTPNDADQATVYFGYCAAPAGDVNGDGYSDVIISAHFYDDGANTDEGRAFVYNGNEFTANKRNNLRLYNTDLTTPLNNTNFNFGNFGAGLFAKSFLGRDKGKMIWETRLNYHPYSGIPITNSTLFTAQQSIYTDLGLNGVELKNVISKILVGGKYTKLRARVKYNPATAITGQVYGPWRNVSSIIDANHIGVLPIDLISFNASWLLKGSTAKIDFVTDKENGICCFDIQKSSDGFSFITIGTVAAKNTSGKQHYTFIDANATSKKQFYRLKIKGTAGQTEYSNIQQLSFNKATEILLFPNPTVDVLHLQLNKNYSSINVQIINVAGQVVKQYNRLAIQNQMLKIPVQNLPSGSYWLQLQNGKDKQVVQFSKQ